MVKGEILTVAVGQCGNQVSRAFWEHAVRERDQCRRSNFPHYDDSSLFQNNSFCSGDETAFRARSILVDTEPGVSS